MTNSRLINGENTNRLFQRLALLTVIVVYLLIFIGGIVRSTGSGMGCPDWPKCFGSWIPPTDISQLPPNYQEIFGAKLKGEVEFNVFKTWTEYLNRLFGVFTGLFIFATLLASFYYIKRDRPVFYMSLVAFLLVGFQGWLGSKVVSAELAPWLVTLHMLLAIVIVYILLYVVARSYASRFSVESVVRSHIVHQWLVWTLLLSLLQVLLGTQVREAMDVVMQELGEAGREQWVDSLGIRFVIHRSYSLLLLGLHIGLCYKVLKSTSNKSIFYRLTVALLVLILIEIATGVLMAYWAVPAFAQPIHLTFATVAIGLQFVMLLLLNTNRLFRPSVLNI
ncbi:MAG: COX15/CtaA family protein [Spirosomataceae bacterium]